MKKYNQMSHPGIILKREFVIPYEISAYRLAKDARIDNMAISEILRCKRSIQPKQHLNYQNFLEFRIVILLTFKKNLIFVNSKNKCLKNYRT